MARCIICDHETASTRTGTYGGRVGTICGPCLGFPEPASPKRRPATRSEHDEQKALISWARASEGRWPELALLYAVPNGGLRHPATAGRLRAEGVRPGVPDLCLPVQRGGHAGLYVELKASKGRTSAQQDWWLAELRRQGYCVAVCYGAEEAQQLIEAYLKGRIVIREEVAG